MSKKKKPTMEDLKQMLINWRDTDLVKATVYYKYIENEKGGFQRGYNSAIHAVITKIENENY